LEAEAEWDLWFSDEGLVMAKLCWDFMGVRKCLTYGRVDDILPIDGGGEPTDCEVETDDIGDFDDFLYTALPVGQCFQGSIGESGDSADGFDIPPPLPESSLKITVRALNSNEGRVRIYRQSPIRGNEIVDDSFDSVPTEYTFNQGGDNFWVEVYGEGGPVEYEIMAELVE
jgi:hypothetical protein